MFRICGLLFFAAGALSSQAIAACPGEDGWTAVVRQCSDYGPDCQTEPEDLSWTGSDWKEPPQTENQPYSSRLVYFGTNRTIDKTQLSNPHADIDMLFENKIDSVIRYGWVLVSMPFRHQGAVYIPEIGDSASDNPATYSVVVQHKFVPQFDQDTTNQNSNSLQLGCEIRHELATRTHNDLALYIHGADNKLSYAASRLAQIMHYTANTNPAVIFSWPSNVSLIDVASRAHDSQSDYEAFYLRLITDDPPPNRYSFISRLRSGLTRPPM